LRTALGGSEEAAAGGVARSVATSEARGAAQGEAESAGSGAAKAPGCNSFQAGTLVLLANRTTKAIEQLKLGDRVLAADPRTGVVSGGEPVTHRFTNHDDDLLDLNVHTRTGDTVIHTTDHHPFYDTTRHEWIDAANLPVGDRLATTSGEPATVVAATTLPGQAVRYNLTVENLHTYYILTNTTPTLVHNCGEDLDFAHGTTAAHADSIAANGLSSDAARAASNKGSVAQPGNLFTYRVSGPADPNFSTAAQWGVTRNGGSKDGAAVLVFRMCKCDFDRLLSEGHITTRFTGEGMPEETIFGPGAMPFLRKLADVRLK
jgi:hypothetical protein